MQAVQVHLHADGAHCMHAAGACAYETGMGRTVCMQRVNGSMRPR